MTTVSEPFNEAMAEILAAHVILYGPPGVGKTTFTSSWPAPGFFAFEPGHKFLQRGTVIASCPFGTEGWARFRNCLNNLPALLENVHTIVVDTADGAYDACFAWVCSQNRVAHASDIGSMGKGWDMVKREFRDQTLKLVNYAEETKKRTIWISHANQQEVRALGNNYWRVQPTLRTQAYDVLTPVVDYIWYLGYDTEAIGKSRHDLKVVTDERSLIMHGGESYLTKDRSGKLPADIRRFSGKLRDVISAYTNQKK